VLVALLHVSATFWIEVTESVLATLAVAVDPVAVPEVELPAFEPLASPALAFPGALLSGLFVAEADACDPGVPVT
jgi:hypothetical protein